MGHADLNVHWVGAGHLEIGDKIRTADGSSGNVVAVVNVSQARVMFNLEVDGNHDFFVGENGWLVHNAGPCAWTSPAGLVYDLGSKHGNRLQHIFEHLAENPKKVAHSVFDVGSSADVLPLIDEAYLRIQSLGLSHVPGDPMAFVIPMGRTIGTKGEASIKLVLKQNTTEVISAYPIK